MSDQTPSIYSEVVPSKKDEILKSIIGDLLKYQPILIDFDTFYERHGVSKQAFRMIIDQFIERGFLNEKSRMGYGNVNVSLNARAVDHLNRGGFYAEEELLKAELEKLTYELEQFQSALPERVSVIAGIAANIGAVLGMLQVR